jgi:hypothetical protein
MTTVSDEPFGPDQQTTMTSPPMLSMAPST